jgi:hypothetical protein
MTVLLEKAQRWSETPAIVRPDAEVPPGPPPGPARPDGWRWIPDPPEAAPPTRPSWRAERLLRIYAWARTIGF